MSSNSLYKSSAGQKQIMAMYDSVLARWPVPREELCVPTRHGKTFAIASGDPSAPALVLLHGASSNAVSWVGDIPTYSLHFRVYAVDIPGDPGRSDPNRPSWNGPAYAEWMDDFVDGIKAHKVSLLGLSQGAWNAIKFSAYRPERVEKLVLLSPAGVVPDKLSFILRAILFSTAGRRGAEASVRMVFGREPIHEDARKFMNLIMTQFKSRVGRLVPFTDQELGRLSMPTLLVGGKRDAVRDVQKIEIRLKKNIPNLHSILYPGKGHVLVNLSEEITQFLLQT